MLRAALHSGLMALFMWLSGKIFIWTEGVKNLALSRRGSSLVYFDLAYLTVQIQNPRLSYLKDGLYRSCCWVYKIHTPWRYNSYCTTAQRRSDTSEGMHISMWSWFHCFNSDPDCQWTCCIPTVCNVSFDYKTPSARSTNHNLGHRAFPIIIQVYWHTHVTMSGLLIGTATTY